MPVSEHVFLFASTARGVSKQQSVTSFEDDLAKQYRDIAHRIPVEALLGRQLSDEEYTQTLAWFYQYIDLSNEETFLRQKGRVRPGTWENWCAGIKSNLGRPAFAKAWEEIKARSPKSFEELKRLEKSGFQDDPKKWGKQVA